MPGSNVSGPPPNGGAVPDTLAAPHAPAMPAVPAVPAPPVQVAQADPPQSDWVNTVTNTDCPPQLLDDPDAHTVVRPGHGNGIFPSTQSDCFLGMVAYGTGEKCVSKNTG